MTSATKRMHSVLATGIATLYLSIAPFSAAQSAVIANQPPQLPAGSGLAFLSDANGITTPGLGGPQAGDDFSLVDDLISKRTTFEWWGLYAGGDGIATDHFTLRFFNADLGPPLTVTSTPALELGPLPPLAVERNLTGEILFGAPVYKYSVLIPDFTLNAGDYLFSPLNNTGSDTDNWFWRTHDTGNPVDNAQRRDSDAFGWARLGSTEPTQGAEFAFRITVPGPATPAIFLLSLGILASLRRKNQTG